MTCDGHLRNLVHPREILKHDFMEPWGLSTTALGPSPVAITEIVRRRRRITAATALRLARYFRTDAQTWMNLQTSYELELATRTAARALQAIPPAQRREAETRHP